ncbi:MAG: transketolase family protein [Anaerolineales bacterium]|nr:transketolase family protein [Anaerolineales bacterium]
MNSQTIFADRVYGHTLAEMGAQVPELVVLDSDLQRATEANLFQEQFPERYFNIGVQEANMVGMAAGLALSGKKVFCGSFACFMSQRVLDQAAISVAYCRANVKLVGIEAGLSSGRNGASHQAMLDLAVYRALPNMSVLVPADAVETRQIVEYLALEHQGPAYLRIQRKRVPVVLEETYRFSFGQAGLLRQGGDLTIMASGIMVARALSAAETLAQNGIHVRVLNFSTYKPLDREAVLSAAEETGAVVVAENHSVFGGLYGAVSEVLAAANPVPVNSVAIEDVFGEVGDETYLAQKFGLTEEDIVGAAQDVLLRKRAMR